MCRLNRARAFQTSSLHQHCVRRIGPSRWTSCSRIAKKQCDVGRRLRAPRRARRTKPSSPKRLTYSLRLARLQKRRPSPPMSGCSNWRGITTASSLSPAPRDRTIRPRLSNAASRSLVPCEQPRLTTTQGADDKDYPVSTCQRSATARWRFCDAQCSSQGGGRRTVRYSEPRSPRRGRAVLRAVANALWSPGRH
jgi:hypothetical protein